MIDVIKLKTSKCRILSAALTTAESHPLYEKRTVTHSRLNRSKLVSIQFGHQGRRFVTLKHLEGEDGGKFLVGIDANLPAILHGHNGRLIKNQSEMLLALTFVRHIVEPFVHPDDLRLALPGRDKENTAYIKSIEVPIQLQDPGSEILLAAHLTACKNFVRPSQIFPGQSVVHRSSAMDVAFYDKLEESGEGACVPPDQGATRIEARFKTPRRLAEALGIGSPGLWAVAALPFEDLEFAFQKVMTGTLIGALADAAEKPAPRLSPATRSILKLAGDHVSLLATLAEQQRTQSKRAFGKIRRQVYHELARMFPVSLPSLIGSWKEDLMSEIVIVGLEAEHQRMKARLGWPTEPDADIAETFSGLLMANSMDPGRKHFIRHSKGDPF